MKKAVEPGLLQIPLVLVKVRFDCPSAHDIEWMVSAGELDWCLQALMEVWVDPGINPDDGKPVPHRPSRITTQFLYSRGQPYFNPKYFSENPVKRPQDYFIVYGWGEEIEVYPIDKRKASAHDP